MHVNKEASTRMKPRLLCKQSMCKHHTPNDEDYLECSSVRDFITKPKLVFFLMSTMAVKVKLRLERSVFVFCDSIVTVSISDGTKIGGDLGEDRVGVRADNR